MGSCGPCRGDRLCIRVGQKSSRRISELPNVSESLRNFCKTRFDDDPMITARNVTGATLAPTPVVPPTFGELAKSRTLPLFDLTRKNLDRITSTSMPHEPELKALRKDMQRLRDHLDIFAFSYGGKAREKVWTQLRNQLDEGYEELGAFKDLFDSQGLALSADGKPPAETKYSDKEVKKSREKLQKWVKEFTSDANQKAWRELLNNPSQKIEDVEPKSLSKFFWGKVDFKPKASDSGLVTVGKLASRLAQDSEAAVKSSKKLSDLTKSKKKGELSKDEEEFHDTRKRLRSTSNLLKNFSDLATDEIKALLVTVDSAVGKYGDIEDDLVAYHRAIKADKQNAAAKLKNKIDDELKLLQRWQKEVDLEKVLNTLSKTVFTR
jgi:CHAD domain-containing protein